MSQTRIGSLTESFLQVFIGYWIAIGVQVVLFPVFGFHANTAEHLVIGFIFLVVSLVRSYVLRRLFNWWSVRHADG